MYNINLCLLSFLYFLSFLLPLYLLLLQPSTDFICFPFCNFFLPKVPNLNFSIFGFLWCTARKAGRIQTLNSSDIVCPYHSVLISKLVTLSIYLFFTFLFGSYCPEFFALSSTITITMPIPVLYNYMASLAYGGKKSGDVGLICRCHMSNTMPDIIFHECMG